MNTKEFKKMLKAIEEKAMQGAREIDLEDVDIEIRIKRKIDCFGDKNETYTYYNVWYGHHYFIKKYFLIDTEKKVIEPIKDGIRVAEAITKARNGFLLRIMMENYEVENNGKNIDKWIVVDLYPI